MNAKSLFNVRSQKRKGGSFIFAYHLTYLGQNVCTQWKIKLWKTNSEKLYPLIFTPSLHFFLILVCYCHLSFFPSVLLHYFRLLSFLKPSCSNLYQTKHGVKFNLENKIGIIMYFFASFFSNDNDLLQRIVMK